MAERQFAAVVSAMVGPKIERDLSDPMVPSDGRR